MDKDPSFDEVLKQAMKRVDNEDVRLFYAYIDDLKKHARAHLRGKARAMPGEMGVAHAMAPRGVVGS